MFITLTNAAEEFRGDKIAIKKDLIVTIRSDARTTGNTIEMVTYIFAPPHGTWEVSETFDQVMGLLDSE